MSEKPDVLAIIRDSFASSTALDTWYESAADLLNDDDPGSTPFLADELIVDGSITAVVGSPKHGKTWVLLDIAIAVETGENALGRFAVPKPVQCC